MKRTVALIVASVVVSLGPGEALADGFAVRARPAGLDFLERVAPLALPTELDLPDIEKDLFDCPGLDIQAVTRDGTASITWHKLDFEVANGTFQIDAVIDLTAATELRVKRGFACIGELVCDVSASATPVSLRLQLREVKAADGSMQPVVVDVDLGLSADDFALGVDNCSLGTAVEWFTTAYEEWLLEAVIARVESIAAERLGARLGGALGNTVPLRIEKGGLAIDVQVSGVGIGNDTGVTVVGDADVTWMGEDDGGAPATSEPTSKPLPDSFGPGEFAFAASDQLVTRTIYAAWRGGVFDAILGQLSPSSRSARRAKTSSTTCGSSAHPALADTGILE